MSVAMPELDQRLDEDITVEPARPWKVLLWNDDVNTITYVVMTLQRIIKRSKDDCEKMAHEAHTKGKALVFSGKQEEAQSIAAQLGAATLWATLEKEG